MDLPTGVTVEQWAAALHVIAHPWREGQKCMEQGEYHWCATHNDDGDHNIPMPAVTNELLMRMLTHGCHVNRDFLIRIDYHWNILYLKRNPTSLVAAIILATASLDGK